MPIQSRPFSDENDLQALKTFVSSIITEDMQRSYWHVGDLLWGIYKNTVYDQGFSHFVRRRVKSERRYSQRASLKRSLSFFMHPPRHLAETLLRSSLNNIRKSYRLPIEYLISYTR